MEITSFSEYKDYNKLKKVMNLSLPYDFIDDIFLETLTLKDPNFTEDNIMVAIEKDEIIGFVFGVSRDKEPKEVIDEHKDIMWIKAFGVLPEYRENRETKVLTKLFNMFEKLAHKRSKKKIRISDYASWYLTPGIDNLYDFYNNFLVEKGYKRYGSTVNYEIDMSHFYIPKYVYRLKEKKLTSNNISIDIIRKPDKQTLEWIEEHFSVFWRTEAKIAMENDFGGVLIARKNKEILGFSTYGSLHPSWFGPVGVSKDARGLGIGTVLLFETLKVLRENGQRIVTIPWTSHLFYYTQLPGVTRIRHFNIYLKEIM